MSFHLKTRSQETESGNTAPVFLQLLLFLLRAVSPVLSYLLTIWNWVCSLKIFMRSRGFVCFVDMAFQHGQNCLPKSVLDKGDGH